MRYPDRFDFLTFDCYGTLVDWERGIVDALGPVIASHSIRIDEGNILTLYAELEAKLEKVGYRPYREILVEVVRGFGKRLGFRPSASDETCLVDSIPSWKPFEDTVPALEALGRIYDLAVISNIDDDLFAATHKTLGVELHSVITAQQVRAYKPERRVFEHALEEIGRPASRVIHVAQSMYHDINTAHELSITTAWVNRPAGRRGPGATLPAAGQADIVVPDLASLVPILT